MEVTLTNHWSTRALDTLRTAPVIPRRVGVNRSPTHELDDELYELTGKRGMPIIDAIILGYPATTDTWSEDGVRSSCPWGRGRMELRLRSHPDHQWETSDLGYTLPWRACVELLVLQQQYRTWIPTMVCEDARPVLPRRWGRDLARTLGLEWIPEVEDALMSPEILCWGSHFLTRSIGGFARLLHNCNEHGFSATIYAQCAPIKFVDEVNTTNTQTKQAQQTLHLPRSRHYDESIFSLHHEELIRETRRFRGHTIEIVDSSPRGIQRIRRHPPALGSNRLREYLQQNAVSMPSTPPCVATPSALEGAVEELNQLERTLIVDPREGNMWLGLWHLDELPDTARRAAPTALTVARDTPKITRTEWPFYRWGDLDMICIGGGPEFESYLRDATGAIWFCDVAYGHFGFVCGSTISWLERIAFSSRLDAMSHESPLLTIPLRAWDELPRHFNVPLVPECSDPRARLYVSSTYTILESDPTHGTPVVELRARSSRELIPVVQWAKRHWKATKVAVSGSDEALRELVDAIHDEDIQLLDGETGGWKTTTFWEN
jgi:hypothetical protein